MKKSKKDSYIEKLHLEIDRLKLELSQEKAVKAAYLGSINFMLHGENRKAE